IGAVDRRSRRLERARIIHAIAPSEVGILEANHAAGGIGWAGHVQPRVLDPLAEIAGRGARADADDLDRLDPLALIRRVVALVETQVMQALWRERVVRVRGAAGLLHEAADRAHLEARLLPLLDDRAHRRAAVGSIEQIEPEQDARAA